MWFHASDSLNYEQAIADGSWPTSVEILERRLRNAEVKKKQAAVSE